MKQKPNTTTKKANPRKQNTANTPKNTKLQ